MHAERRKILLGLGAMLALRSRRARAQSRSIPLVGVLSAGTTFLPRFRIGLREAGHIEGQTLLVEHRPYEGRLERIPALAANLLALRPAVLVGSSPHVIDVLKRQAGSTPVVAIDLESDPVAAGYVASLARPGGNITGLFLDLPELSGKLLQLLVEVAPGRGPIGVLWDESIAASLFEAVQGAARTAGFSLVSLPIKRQEECNVAIQRAARERARGLLVLTSPLVSLNRELIGRTAREQRLPSVSAFLVYAEAGGLLAYGPDIGDMFRRAAFFVDRILKGARPAEMPVERPDRFELVINLKTAAALKITVPPAILGQADRVIR